MDELKITSNFGVQSEACSSEVQSFLVTSARYLGIVPFSGRVQSDYERMTAAQVVPRTGHANLHAPAQRLESRVQAL